MERQRIQELADVSYDRLVRRPDVLPGDVGRAPAAKAALPFSEMRLSRPSALPSTKGQAATALRWSLREKPWTLSRAGT